MNPDVQFHQEDIEISDNFYVNLVPWITGIVRDEGGVINCMHFIFCSDAYLLNLNKLYLGHNTLTDIITFPYSKFPILESDIFISVERVSENAKILQHDFRTELSRVMIHGVLHLCNYADHNEMAKKEMRQKEDEALKKLVNMNII